MPKGKRILLESHHFPTKDAQVLWADVWISATVKPGRKRKVLAPTLVSAEDLAQEEATNVRMKWEPEPDHADAKAALAAGATHFIGAGRKDMENVYAPESLINRATAERLCLAYANANGIAATRVKWKRGKVFTIPA